MVSAGVARPTSYILGAPDITHIGRHEGVCN